MIAGPLQPQNDHHANNDTHAIFIEEGQGVIRELEHDVHHRVADKDDQQATATTMLSIPSGGTPGFATWLPGGVRALPLDLRSRVASFGQREERTRRPRLLTIG